ncbi:MAG: 3-oxoadipate enol-lactonase 2 [Tenericutes bacterium ADurb.Bin087]|nr:MAG: 3-oxoadipate enol-lactonase 2 [Tenericutes bacterium ADurb.Bin087]
MAIFKFKNYDFYYEVHGDMKNPFLLLNGIMMSTRSWTPFIEEFAEKNTLILIDFLDQGQSSKARENYTQDFQVEMLKAFLDYLKIKKLPIVGISYGGEVALQFAVKYLDYVESLMLLNTCAMTSPWLKDLGAAWNKAGETGDGLAYYLTTIPLIYSPAFYTEKLDWMKKREAILTPLFSNKVIVDGFIRLTKSAENHDVRDKLGKINVPTLIISAKQDYLTPIEDQYYLAKRIPNANHITIENSGHASMYERPALFVTLVLGFVNKKHKTYTI